MTQLVCGVDVSSLSLQASVGRHGATGSFPNTPAGIALLAAFCRAHGVTLVAMEATGGHGRRAFTELALAALPVAVLNPRSVASSRPAWASSKKPPRSTPP